MYILSFSPQHKLLVKTNNLGPQKVQESSTVKEAATRSLLMLTLYVCWLCKQTINLSFLSYPFMYWTNWCPSAIITQTKCSCSLHKGSHRGGFPLHFPSHPHKGDPFHPLLAAAFSTFRSSDCLPEGINGGRGKIKTPGGCLESLGLWQTDISSQSHCGWMDFAVPGRRQETDTGAGDDPNVWFRALSLHAYWELVQHIWTI